MPSDRVRKAVSAIQDAEVIEDLQDVVDTLENLTSDEIAVLANAAMDHGRKFMLVWFLNRYPHAIPSNELHMNATEVCTVHSNSTKLPRSAPFCTQCTLLTVCRSTLVLPGFVWFCVVVGTRSGGCLDIKSTSFLH